MDIFQALSSRLGAERPQRADRAPDPAWDDPEEDAPPREPRDLKRLYLVIGLGALSWVATYVGMLELIEANMGDLPLIHKLIVGFSVAMLMTMIIWLLDRIFAPVDPFTKACYVAGYLFLSVISIGFGFGFYWKVLESRGEASRSAESAITQVQTSLFGAATRLEQLQSTLDQLTTVSSEKSEVERSSGKSCPNSGPGDGPRRKMREDDAARFKFASDFAKGRVGTVKSDMAALEGDLQKIVKDDRSVIDAKTGNRNDFLRGVGRKLDLTVTGFNAFRTDPQLRQIRSDLADRAEKTTVTGAKGVTISCPDAQLQMALRGVVRAIDQLPELEKPKIAAVEGSEATIEAFRRLTTTFFGLLSFKLPPSADELRELQRKAVQSVETQAQPGAGQRSAYVEQAAGLAKRDYVPLSVAIFVDLCLLLVSMGRPVNRFVGMQNSIREAERGPVYPILSRFHEIHSDSNAVKIFEVFREVIFDLNGQYHVAVPLNVPRHAPDREALRREAQNLTNICYALEGKGILVKPISFLPSLVAYRQLKKRGSKFVECYGDRRPARLKRGFESVRSVWADTPYAERPAFKVYRFRKGAWPEMILGAVMGAARRSETLRAQQATRERTAPTFEPGFNGEAVRFRSHPAPNERGEHAGEPEAHPSSRSAFGTYARYMEPRYADSQMRPPAFTEPSRAHGRHADEAPVHVNGNGFAHANGFAAAKAAGLAAAAAPSADLVAEPELEPVDAANNNTEPSAALLMPATPLQPRFRAGPPPLPTSSHVEPVRAAETVDEPLSHHGPFEEVQQLNARDEAIESEPDTQAERIEVEKISGWFQRMRRKA